MRSLFPFFTYYGGKWRIAPKYPPPRHEQIVEPFGGSAGYSLRYPDRSVWINDSDPVVAGTWKYLVSVDEREILALPDMHDGQTVEDLNVPQEARWLIGWWLNKGSAQPKSAPSTFMSKFPTGGPYWGERVRLRIATQLSQIRHWTITNQSYDELPNLRATWFIDPPYVHAGKHYRHGSAGLDYGNLADWAKARTGQVIACEADGANWLPFQQLVAIHGTEGRQKMENRARVETLWTKDG